MNGDPFEAGIPKITASSIYDALCELVQTEEMSILSEMFADVSYDGQTYYYTDKGATLKEEFEKLSEHGDKMWIMDLAVLQVDKSEIHDLVYEALKNSDLAKRLGFKKLFIDKMLGGDKSEYNEIAEDYAAELEELDRFATGGAEMNLATLIVAIEVKRREMYDARPEDRLRVSQELDLLINEYYRIKAA